MVAYNFSAGSGLVCELKYAFSQFPLRAKYFDCAPFSDYPNEKECLFIAGIPILQITNIINISNDEDYRKYIEAINVINGIFKGTLSQNKDTNKDITTLAVDLINNRNNDTGDIPEYIRELMVKYCTNLRNMLILWDNVFGKKNSMHQELLDVLTVADDTNFVNINKIMQLFPNLVKIEYFKKSLSKKQILNLAASIIEQVENINSNQYDTKLKYIIIHHEYSSITSDRNQSQSLLPSSVFTSISKQPLLIINAGNQYNNQWAMHFRKNKIVICQNEESDVIDDLDYQYNDIKQGYTSLCLLSNFE